MSWRIEGFAEQGLGTTRPDDWLTFFLELGAWECRWEGPAQEQPLWPADALRPTREWLLARPGHSTGAIRLFEFPAHTPVAREGAATWDSGGFFDIDVRVADLEAWHRQLRARHWGGMSEPVDWSFGELSIREWLARGPDDVVVAIIQRLAPPLDPPPPASGFSHVFNASQTVRDLDSSLRFFEALGFRTVARHGAPLAGSGGEVLGLGAGEAPHTHVDLAITSPSGIMDGSVELVALPDKHGRDLAPNCNPGQRGLNIMRFPARGLESLALDLREQGITIEAMARWRCEPLGIVRGMALKTPDGAWLELLEIEP